MWGVYTENHIQGVNNQNWRRSQKFCQRNTFLKFPQIQLNEVRIKRVLWTRFEKSKDFVDAGVKKL